MRTEPRFRKRAMIYVAVLGTAALVSLIGLSALTAVRVRYRSTQGSADAIEAAFYAQSAIEYGMYMIENDADWRSNQWNGYWKTNEKLGGGSFSLQGIDPSDGDLGNSNGDPLVLIGTGYKGSAQHTLRVRLESAGQPLTCLETSLHADGELVLNGATIVSNQIISTNNDAVGNSADVYADVEAAGVVTGQYFNQSFASGADARTMPDGTTVFDDYLALAAPMDINLVPTSGPIRSIRQTLISPLNNPYGGTTQIDGIYVLDCQWQSVIIEDCRIYGTLVLLNFGDNTEIRDSVNWEPVLSNYPALLARGYIPINLTSTPLSESTLGVNFNPPGAPYLGDTNGDTLDTYSSMISGLVYVSGDLTTGASSTFEGVVVVGGALTATGTLNLTYRQTFLDNPPPGFGSAGIMAVSPGTWRRVVN